MKIPKERFKDVLAIIFFTRYIEVTQSNQTLDNELSNIYTEDEFEEFLSEYVEWRKEEKNKLKLEDGWYKAEHISGVFYYLYVKDNLFYIPWLGKDFSRYGFSIQTKQCDYKNFIRQNYGPFETWDKVVSYIEHINDNNLFDWMVKE